MIKLATRNSVKLGDKSTEFSKEVNRITSSFTIWNGKPPKIKKSTIISCKSKGGLKIIDFGLFNTAIKAAWVKRFCSPSDADWKTIPQ